MSSEARKRQAKALLDQIAARQAGTFQDATGYTVDTAAPPPLEGRALDWPTLYEQGEPPDRRWAEMGWLGFDHVTLLVGQGGIGKTLLAQQWGAGLSIGRRLLNEPGDPLKVMMWACEDDHDELWRRQVAIANSHGTTLREYENFKLIPRAGISNALVVSEFGRPMFTPLIDTLQTEAAPYDVVILDNVAQLYGAGENDRHAVTFFINGLTGALRGKAILLLAHPSKSTGSEFSGSTAWEASARTRLYLGNKLPDEEDEAEPDENLRYFARRKANYSNRDYRRLIYQDGVLLPEVRDMTGGIFTGAKKRQSQRIVLAALEKLLALRKFPNDSERSPNFLPKMIIAHKLSEGCARRDLTEGMRDLLVEGKILISEIGRDPSRHPVMGLKPC